MQVLMPACRAGLVSRALVSPSPALSLDSVRTAQWATMPHEKLAAVFLDELRAFTAASAEESSLSFFSARKLILAVPFHGGKMKAAATERMVARRIERWHAGQVEQMWLDMLEWWRRMHKHGRPKSSSQSW